MRMYTRRVDCWMVTLVVHCPGGLGQTNIQASCLQLCYGQNRWCYRLRLRSKNPKSIIHRYIAQPASRDSAVPNNPLRLIRLATRWSHCFFIILEGPRRDMHAEGRSTQAQHSQSASERVWRR
ncbi:hypothetical protein B0T25DRAFT_324994 [Lasiosphaeria hispida]|uniref:Secreted protein n=1 Tax=Lasiosphaeria hispida TaxID=260671 RepID=A0AAJ0H9R2_9PEZI|nr:hypothetical protein B0T25DRAFT_324994 [Lasiosphaeria hispida]